MVCSMVLHREGSWHAQTQDDPADSQQVVATRRIRVALTLRPVRSRRVVARGDEAPEDVGPVVLPDDAEHQQWHEPPQQTLPRVAAAVRPAGPQRDDEEREERDEVAEDA